MLKILQKCYKYYGNIIKDNVKELLLKCYKDVTLKEYNTITLTDKASKSYPQSYPHIHRCPIKWTPYKKKSCAY